MRRWIAIVLVLVCLSFAGCEQPQEQPQDDALVTAYLEAAQTYIDSGDLETAIAALEEGCQKTGNNEKLVKLLEEVKAQQSAQQETESSTETAAPTTETPAPPAQTTLVSSYPIQIDMNDMLSANLLGQTFYSAYENKSLDSWMFLYVHGCSDPPVIYDSLWFDAKLGQMTYYGILQQQAVDAGWGEIWVELVNGEVSGTAPLEGQPIDGVAVGSFVGTWRTQNLAMTVRQYDNNSHLIEFSQGSSSGKTVFFDTIVPFSSFHNGEVSFTFQDDGWGNTGTVHLKKQSGSITCTIQDLRYIGQGSCAMWGIEEGEYQLTLD